MSDEVKGVAGKHSVWQACLFVAQLPVLVLTMTLNFLAASGQPIQGLYVSQTEYISDKYETALTPAPWTFSIWTFIYIFLLLHIGYNISLIFRKNKDGCYLYISPGHVHFSFPLVLILNNCLNFSWILLWDRELIEVSFVFLCLNTFSLYVCGILTCWYLAKAGAYLESSGNVKDIWLTRLLTLNGVAFYATWVTPASLLNFASVLQYRAGVAAETSAWICLVILTIEIIAWFVLETFVFDRHLRYCFTPYVVLMVALSGIVSKKFDATAPTAYHTYVVVLLGVAAVLGVVKVIVMVVRGRLHPITYVSNSDAEENA